MVYYAVANGRNEGVYDSLEVCQEQVLGYSRAVYRKFDEYYHGLKFIDDYDIKCRGLEGHNHYIYTDGACRGNGKHNQGGSGFGVFWGDDDVRNTCQSLRFYDSPDIRCTNQRAELSGIRYALEQILKECKGYLRNQTRFSIVTDSQYALNSLMSWPEKWQRNGWRNVKGQPVANQDIIQICLKHIDDINEHYHHQGWFEFEIIHVLGHGDCYGNQMADRFANRGADLMEEEESSNYGVNNSYYSGFF